MPTDMFLIIDDFNGESTDPDHTDAIELVSWSWGGSLAISEHGRGGTSGGATFEMLSVSKYFDLASPKLYQELARGGHLPNAKLIQRKAGGDRVEFLVMDLEGVKIASLSSSGADGEDPLEELVLAFDKVELTYQAQLEDGSAGADIAVYIDRTNSREVA